MLYSIEDENMGVVRRLHEHVEPLVTLHKELTFETICVDTAADLFGTLSNLASSVKYKGIPLLHLDMHGDPIRGVKLLSGEYVPWIDLSKKLGTINFQTGNRMAVISAACAGMSVINPPRINDPAPFKCLFSCSENITLGDIQAYFPRILKSTFSEFISRKLLINGFISFTCFYKICPELPPDTV